MANEEHSRHRRVGLMLAVLLFAAGCSEDKTKPLELPPERYEQMVSAFCEGTLALVVGDHGRANEQLTEAAAILPQEPATFANLAVLAVRNSDYASASAAL
jgi:hypothetical protein